MNTTKLRSKRVLLPAIATIAVLGVGATVWTATADDNLEGDARDRVAAAAVEAAGGGEAVDVETSDDQGAAYEVEVRREDGTELDVSLDENLDVVRQDEEGDDDGDESGDADDGTEDTEDTDDTDADDRVLGDAERADAEQAALAAVGGGTVLQVEASDDAGEAYEAEVRDRDGKEWDVALDADFTVLSKTADS
ncbi:putative membrane protein YkoI [Nocardioides thalensis]|uniref:Putative membrane protein YkoI n=1 Tax=Nocardioides thalensis TaxID=1914755 RepID=A0A853BW76_9ACTN|nr:PepSY domain-containing protein [Nocardioides thalensis]NYI99314.1 putative membrane protein YkoI [Nocardioides thalensis]